MLKVLLVGFSPVTSLGIETALSDSLGRVQVTGFASVDSFSRAMDLTELGNFGLIVLDPYRPNFGEGIKFCRRVKEHSSAPRILAFSDVRGERELGFSCMAGIDSFVSATEPPERLAAVAVSALNGKREWVLSSSSHDQQSSAFSTSEGLTLREQEVLWMVSERCTNEQIGRSLSISPNTVKNHVASILRKLGARSRSELFFGAMALSQRSRSEHRVLEPQRA